MLYLYIYLGMVSGAICTLIAMTAMRRGGTHNIGKIGWLSLILLTPPIGLPLFLWLGGKKISAEHDRRELVKMPKTRQVADVSSSMANVASSRGLSQPSGDNQLVLLDTPEKIEETLFDLVESAERRLFIHTFVLIEDKLGMKLIDQLCSKASEGIDVRLMIDGFGSFFFPNKHLEKLRSAGGKAVRFKPFRHLSQFAYFNFRNHRKIVVVDGARAMLGGANLVEYELTQEPDEDTWVDLSLRIDGEVAKQIESVFLSDWQFASDGKFEFESNVSQSDAETHDLDSSEESATLQLIPVGPDGPSEIIDDLWLTAIGRARHRVWIVTPYFVPPPSAMRTLVMAIRRGVDVRIIVPEKSDMRLADYARFDYFSELHRTGANIFRLPERVVHAKVVLIDEEVAYVGSANFDFRSFFLNYELTVGIFNKSKTQEVAAWFESIQQRCDAGIAKDTWRSRFLGTVSRMIAEEL